MSVSNRQLCSATEEALRGTREEVEQLSSLQRGLGRDIATQDAAIAEALDVLAATMLPDLGAAHLDRAVTRLRQPQLSSAKAAARRAQETQELTTSLQRMQRDPQFVRRAAIANELSIQRAELLDTMAPLRESVVELEAEPLWPELLAYRYGTAEYDVPWWKLEYYRHWKNGDLIVEKHGPRRKIEDFKGLVARYLAEKQALAELEANLATVNEREKATQKIVADVARTEELLRTVDERALTRARAAVRDFLQPLPDQDLLRLMADDAGLLLCAKRVCGLRAKQQYLKQLVDESVAPSLADLSSLQTKLERDVAKLRRPKNAHRTWTTADLERRRIGPRREKWQKRRERWSTTRTQIVSFHHYDRWDPLTDVLWWDVMTDGELDGDFVSEVRARGPRHHHHASGVDLDSRDIS